MRKLFKNEEKKHLNIHIYEWDIDVYVSEDEKQRFIKAAEYISKKIEAYMDVYVRQQYLPEKKKCYMEILLMTLLDIVVTSTERKNIFGFNKWWIRINNIIKH